MLYCNNCDISYPADDDQAFCDKCGSPVRPNEEQSITKSQISDVALEQPTTTASNGDGSRFQFRNRPDTHSSSQSNVDIGDKVTNVYNSTVAQDYCAYGGERVYQDKSFRCPECGRDPICTDHFDKGLRLCPFCLESRTSKCLICDTRQLSEKMLKCPRCLKTVCDQHANAGNELCIDCAEQWAGVVAAMESGEVAISMGTVIGTDQIEIKGDSIVTKDGHPVATIKENTWYASPKQWYRVKEQLLIQERQAMKRFYPNMALGFSNDGNAHWQGEVVTWSGKSYTVRLSYPCLLYTSPSPRDS